MRGGGGVEGGAAAPLALHGGANAENVGQRSRVVEHEGAKVVGGRLADVVAAEALAGVAFVVEVDGPQAFRSVAGGVGVQVHAPIWEAVGAVHRRLNEAEDGENATDGDAEDGHHRLGVPLDVVASLGEQRLQLQHRQSPARTELFAVVQLSVLIAALFSAIVVGVVEGVAVLATTVSTSCIVIVDVQVVGRFEVL